ncbi:hypothetical protein [Streptomyces sp. ODS28]|uniref:hypothetical protein n=1 Tax=Streptomyces sp. ODS28 TaxID=3136688 RepID=UPI0031EE44D2
MSYDEYEHERVRDDRVRGGRVRDGSGPKNARGPRGGVPDGLLLAVLALLLGLTVLTWTATGISGLLSRGSWPTGVTFQQTPLAMRALVTQPHDLAGAWPGTPASQLPPGYGLFWGIFISQLLVLTVLAVFALSTFTRARAVRAARRAHTPAEDPLKGRGERRESPRGAGGEVGAAQASEAPQTPLAPEAPEPPKGLALKGERAETPAESPTGEPPTGTAYLGAVPAPQPSPSPEFAPEPEPEADARTRIAEAPGAALVVTADTALWAETKDARAKLGPVHVFDPTHLCDTPARLRWSPHHGCEDRHIAAARAEAMLEPLRSPRPIDGETHTAAVTLLRCWLHAAALDNRPFREVHRWSLSKSAPGDPVQTLRTHTKAAPGAAGELEAVLTGHPERRRSAVELIHRALAPLSQLHVRNACTGGRADRIALESFIDETGTLYVVGEDPEVMPILNALAQSVVEHGRRVAARSSAGRLDPPLTTVLALDPKS